MPAPLAAIRDVELVSVGTWAASTGVTTVTRADLEAMLAAASAGLIDHAPIKLGHASSLNDAIGDGEPAYGWVVPRRIGRNAAGKDTLIGDLVGMPAALAEVAPTAYRRRSVEIAWGVKAGGKSYPAVLTAVALLGVTKPAVKGLADLVALYTETTLEAERTGAVELVEGLEDNPVAVAMLSAARLAGADHAQLEALAASAGARDTASIPTATADPDHTPPETAPPTAGGPTVATYTDAQLRELLSLEEGADVDAALRQLATAEPTPPAPPADPAAPVVPSTLPAPPAAPADPAAPPVTDPSTPPADDRTPELVTLSAGSHAELTELATWARTERRNRVLDDAVRAGRIAPAERSAFAAALERDEQGTTTLLGTLAPRFSTSELGSAAGDTAPADTAAEAAADAFVAATFPELA